MSAWSSRPRQLPLTGRRKGTTRWCDECQAFHRTHRAVGGEELCPAMSAAKEMRREALFAGPSIRPQKPGKTQVVMKPPEFG